MTDKQVSEDEFYAFVALHGGKLGGGFNDLVCAYRGLGERIGSIYLPSGYPGDPTETRYFVRGDLLPRDSDGSP